MGSRYQGSPYWMYQVPVLGTALRMSDDARYWSDYQRNTGFTPRYPGRSYANYGTMLSNQTTSIYKSAMKMMKKRW